MPEFRPLTPDDIDTCLHIWRELEGHYEHPIGGSWTAEKIREEIITGEALAALSDSGDIEAFCLFRRHPQHLEIMLLVTRPRTHRTGAMRALVRALMADLAPNEWIWLEVHAGNVPAVSLYESLGFTLVGERQSYYDDGGKALLYEYKPLQ